MSGGGVENTQVVGVLYPTLYLWYILVSSLDLMLTNTMLHHFGGIEVNTIGLPG